VTWYVLVFTVDSAAQVTGVLRGGRYEVAFEDGGRVTITLRDIRPRVRCLCAV
jgi:hypothetical protein